MVIISWKYIGFAVILFLAGLQSIPEELFEAAAIDGASYWQTQRRITLPLLGPTIRIWAFLSIIGSLQLFDLVYIIWGQYVAATAGTSTMATYMVANGRTAATSATAAPSPSSCSSSPWSSRWSTSASCCAVTPRAPSRKEEVMTVAELRCPRAAPGWPQASLAGGPATYLVALVLVGTHASSPVSTSSSEASGPTRRSRRPVRVSRPVAFSNYAEVLQSATFWRQAGNSTIAPRHDPRGRRARRDGQLRARPLQFRGRGAMYALFAAGLMFPIPSPSRRCTSWSRTWA